jgi:hypothetical protein
MDLLSSQVAGWIITGSSWVTNSPIPGWLVLLFRHDRVYYFTFGGKLRTNVPTIVLDRHSLAHALLPWRLPSSPLRRKTEIVGVDDAEMGEFAYDYVDLETSDWPQTQGECHKLADVNRCMLVTVRRSTMFRQHRRRSTQLR